MKNGLLIVCAALLPAVACLPASALSLLPFHHNQEQLAQTPGSSPTTVRIQGLTTKRSLHLLPTQLFHRDHNLLSARRKGYLNNPGLRYHRFGVLGRRDRELKRLRTAANAPGYKDAYGSFTNAIWGPNSPLSGRSKNQAAAPKPSKHGLFHIGHAN